MAIYTNTNSSSPLKAVEFTPEGISFFHVASPAKVKEAKDWLTSPAVGQHIVTETTVDGQPVLATRGDKTQEELTALLDAHGDKLELYHRKRPFSEIAWQTGATLALVGQGMQLVASGLRPNRKVDWSLRMLAIPNLTATGIILAYGAQRTPDTNRLHFLKDHFNDALGQHLPEGEALPGIDEHRAELRKKAEPPPGILQRGNDFLKRNSVIFGEIGLRYFGAFALAFPVNKWGKAAEHLKAGEFAEAYSAGRSPFTLTHLAGLGSLAGKTVAVGSKAPDPFDPKPHTELDTLRENYTFRTGGIIETMAFGAVAADAFMHKKISFTKGGKEFPDFVSGIGGSLFTIRYIIRYFAPFGVKDTNMDELYAHLSDSLAKMPKEKLPQLLADTAAEVTDHFKDKHLEYNQVYTRLMTDLYRYNNIAPDDSAPVRESGNAVTPAETQPAYARLAPSLRSVKDWARAPAVTHALGVQSAGEPSLAMGA